MADIQITENWFVTVIGWLWKALLSVLAWIGYQQYKRLGDMEQAISKKADKNEVDGKYSDITGALEEHRKESREDFMLVHQNINEVKSYLISKH